MNNWIKINSEKDLPPANKNVLVYCQYQKYKLMFVASFNIDFLSWDSISDESTEMHLITHWMPLPEAPEKINE